MRTGRTRPILGVELSDSDEEEWRNIPGYDAYQASTWGRIKFLGGTAVDGRRRPERILSPSLNGGTGKYFVNIHTNTLRTHVCVHILVALAFHGEQPTGRRYVEHLDGDFTNNRPENLRWAKVRRLVGVALPASLDVVLSELIVDTSDCIEWPYSKSPEGYGRVGSAYAHRLVYEHFYGVLLPEHQVDHLCMNRGCVNPRHLEAVVQRENIVRGNSMSAVHARKTHCIRGHEFDGVRKGTGGREWRTCSECARIRDTADRRRRGVPERKRGTR